jgi:hypothetical protein
MERYHGGETGVSAMAGQARTNPEQPDLSSVKAAAKRRFSDVPGIVGFGVGDGTLRIYVHNIEVRKRLPSEFKGVPLDFVVVGDLSAY